MTVTDSWSFWIDRGGTFTDVVGRGPDGRLRTLKLLSRSPAYADAAIDAMRRMLGVGADQPFPAARVGAIRMGTTLATNALLERAGAKTLLVTTAGFADALTIGDQTRPDLFTLDIVKPRPLHAGVVEADERLDAGGRILRPLDEEALRRELQSALAEGFESVAIVFMHSDLNDTHELRAGVIASEVGFAFITLGAEVSPLPRFLARAETAVADAYLTPLLRRHLGELRDALAGAEPLFMTSGGGLARGGVFRGRDAVLSGPAGGVIGVAETAKAVGAAAVLGFDMGGTSTDVCRFAGALERRESASIAGVRLRAPMLDVETVAAGGGSILAFDGLRVRVGPASAGADPGPAAYGKGGPATVTDANIVLGRLDPAGFAAVFGRDGATGLDATAARAVLADLSVAIGGMSPEIAAAGFIDVAVEHTAAAIRRISTERGFDPRSHALVAFGGASGQIACPVADALGIEEVLCPRLASVLSAWGIGQARMRSHRQAGLGAVLDVEGADAAAALSIRLDHGASADLAGQGATAGARERRARLAYEGADTSLPVPLSDDAAMRAAFETAHRRLFGFTEPDGAIRIASVEVEVHEEESASISPPDRQGQPALATPVDGPHLIVHSDTQIWVAPGWRASPGPDGLVRLIRIAPRHAAPAAADRPDPVTLELFNRRFVGVAQAMGDALERTARSVNIKERLDFSCALFDADGGLVANAPHMPVHLGSMGASVRAVRDRHPTLKAGDAFALNNPYAGGTHLPDITVVMPVFTDEAAAPAFFVAARGHHADVGGVQPGSMPPFSATIEEEGVMLDALAIMSAGAFLDSAVVEALAAGRWPARAPGRNLADLKAQIAACQAGAATIVQMIEVHGQATVDRYMGWVQVNAETCVRRAIGRLRNGRARIPLDGGGEIVLAVSVDAAKGEAVLDFTGTSAQLGSNFNAPSSIVSAAALYVFRTLVDDDIPLNAGCLAPLKLIIPEGSMLNPRSPAAVVAGNVETSQHLVDALYAALGVMANSQGTMNNLTFGDEQTQYYETICGGAGATAGADGADAVHSHMTNSRLTDPEILERRFAVRLERFAIRRGSGGEGVTLGGNGAVRRLRFLAPMEAALLSTRRDHPPAGLEGGGDGLAGRQRLISGDGSLKELPGCFSLMIEPGDVIEIETPGGGGFGSEGGIF